LANMGRSPARIVARGIQCVWTALPCPGDLEYPPLETVREDPLAPGKRRKDAAFVVLDKSQCAAVVRGDGALMLYGRVTYHDVFGKEQTYGFSWLFHYY